MRTRDRLGSVCLSLNPETVGEPNAWVMKRAVRIMDQYGFVSGSIRDEVQLIAAEHPSPHVRELAAELLALKLPTTNQRRSPCLTLAR
jgi:hypothetical protein